MQLALLGLDDETRAIARAAVEERHQIAAVCELSAEDLAALAAAGIPAPEPVPWETLLSDTAVKIDAVVVASANDQEQRAEQLVLLAQASVPLLVAHPAVDSMLVYYRLEMVREETQGVLIAYLPSRWHPLVAQTAALIRAGCHWPARSASAGATAPVGAFDHASFERWAVDRERSASLAHFARDVDLIRRTCGDVTRIGALGSADQPSAYANLAVQLAGAGAVPTRWSIGPVDEESGARLTLYGERGRVVLHMPDDGPWQLDIRRGDASQPESYPQPDWNAAAVALEKLDEAIQQRGNWVAGAGPQESPGGPDREALARDWHDAARSVELAETVVRSLARGRTIEVQHEELSEAGTFKSLMTAWGCGLLLCAVFFFFVLGPSLGRSVLLIVLGLFLVLQLLLTVATRGKKKSGEGDERRGLSPP